MSPDGRHEQALIEALDRLGPPVAALLSRRATVRARTAAAWSTRAEARVSLLDAALDTARHRLGAAVPPECTGAEAWLRRVHEALRDDEVPDRAALWRVLERCAPEAEALARARLDGRVSPAARAAVLERLARLCAVLGEDPNAWRVPLVRLAPLAAVPVHVWRALGCAPAWAVVRALADTAASGDAYRRGVATLARSPGAWAVVPVRRAARHVRSDAVPDADPERLGTLLAQWPWPAADPPLAMVGAFAETGRDRVGEDAWAAGLHYGARASEAFVTSWPSAEAHTYAVERLAPRIRAALDRNFEARAVAHIAHWLSGRPYTVAECAASMAHARIVLERMRALWANDPLLSPRTPARHALRLVPADAMSLFPDDPEHTHERLRPARVLVWRVPCTSPERAIVAAHGLAEPGADLAARTAFDVAVSRPDAPMAHTYPADPASPERDRRERAVMAIIARVADELHP